MRGVPAPPDLADRTWERVRAGESFVALTTRPRDEMPLLVVSAPLAELADLVPGHPAVWSDVDHAERIHGPRLAIVIVPEEGSRLASRFDAAQSGSGEWRPACGVDLTDPRARALCGRIVHEGSLYVLFCDPTVPEVASRLAFRISEETLETLDRAVRAAHERWPRAGAR
jgi:hypothetical protein